MAHSPVGTERAGQVIRTGSVGQVLGRVVLMKFFFRNCLTSGKRVP